MGFFQFAITKQLLLVNRYRTLLQNSKMDKYRTYLCISELRLIDLKYGSCPVPLCHLCNIGSMQVGYPVPRYWFINVLNVSFHSLSIHYQVLVPGPYSVFIQRTNAGINDFDIPVQQIFRCIIISSNIVYRTNLPSLIFLQVKMIKLLPVRPEFCFKVLNQSRASWYRYVWASTNNAGMRKLHISTPKCRNESGELRYLPLIGQ